MNKVFFVPISYSPVLYERLLPTLTAQERAYISKYKLFKRRYESLLARVVIKKMSGVNEILVGENGQPFLPSSSLQISIAHCEGAVLVGLCAHKIGVDVEPAQTIYDAYHFLHPKEITMNSEDFLTIWTIKEAFVKCHAGGFSFIDPTKIQCSKEDSKWIFREYLNTINTQKIGDFQTTVVTLSPNDIKTFIINERNLMTF